jgi:hypothetical protein
MHFNNTFWFSGLSSAIVLVLFAVAPPKRGVMPRWLKVFYSLVIVAGVFVVMFAHAFNMSRVVALVALTPGALFVLLVFLSDRYGPLSNKLKS